MDAVIRVMENDVRFLGRTAKEVIPLLAGMWGRAAVMDALGDSSSPVSLGLVPYSQRDPEWANDVLGLSDGRWTMGNGGCAVTSLAITASRRDRTLTPGMLNEQLRNVGAFYGAELDWTAVERALPYMRLIARYDWGYPVPDDALDTVRGFITRYGSVIAEVDFQPSTVAQDMHFCVMTELLENDARIIDPWDGAETWLIRRYALEGQSLARALWGVRVYSVEV